MAQISAVPPLAGSAGVLPTPAARPGRIPPAVLRASLRNSIKDAIAWSVMQGAGTNYVMPFVILGGKGLLYVAAFGGLPVLVGAIVQWLAANVTDAVGRRNRIIVSSSFLQALVWVPIGLAIFLPFDAVGYWVMLGAFVVNLGLANFGVPAWQSLMGELVPAARRGRYFGLRNALSGGVFVAAFFASGAWLTLCERRDEMALLGLSGRNFGFLVLFAIAGGARLVSTWYLSRIHEPPYRPQAADRFSLLEFIRRAPRAHFGRFVFYSTIMNVGVGAVTPFLPWFWFDQRHFSPAAFATVMTANLLAGVLSQPWWGRLIDRLGSKRVLGIGGIGMVLSPPLLLLCDSFWSFAAIMAYDGIVYAAFTTTVGTYLYDVVTPPKRVRCAAYNNLFMGAGTLVGSFGAAALGQFVPLPLNVGGMAIMQPFTLMLLASAVVRLLANVLLLGSFEEFRLQRPAFATEPGQ
jgi:MFS family permease